LVVNKRNNDINVVMKRREEEGVVLKSMREKEKEKLNGKKKRIS
jgi:hypothetical protein